MVFHSPVNEQLVGGAYAELGQGDRWLLGDREADIRKAVVSIDIFST